MLKQDNSRSIDIFVYVSSSRLAHGWLWQYGLWAGVETLDCLRIFFFRSFSSLIKIKRESMCWRGGESLFFFI
jgi:hypothetical protein